MKKIYLFLLFVSVFAINANAQVTIGSSDVPERGTVLELKSDTLGFLPTRVALVSLSNPDLNPIKVNVDGMVVYNLTTDLGEGLQPGLYCNDGTRWMRLSTSSFKENWFYMPSIVVEIIPTPENEADLTIDLYGEFLKQLGDDQNTKVVASTGTPNAPPKVLSTVPAATDLYYYITDYDDNVFDIKSISDGGLMTYRIKDEPATDATFLNIVFVEK